MISLRPYAFGTLRPLSPRRIVGKLLWHNAVSAVFGLVYALQKLVTRGRADHGIGSRLPLTNGWKSRASSGSQWSCRGEESRKARWAPSSVVHDEDKPVTDFPATPEVEIKSISKQHRHVALDLRALIYRGADE